VLHIDSYVPVSKAKANLLDMVRVLRDSQDTIAITRNGVPEAVLISMEGYEGLMETLEILADSETMKTFAASFEDAKVGRWVDEAEVSRALQD